MKLIVMAPSGAPLVGGDALVEAARARFGDRARVHPSPAGWETGFHIFVALEGETLTISHFPDDTSVSVESGDAEVADAVAWLRSLLPPDFPRLIASDGGWNGHVELTYGIGPPRGAGRLWPAPRVRAPRVRGQLAAAATTHPPPA